MTPLYLAYDPESHDAYRFRDADEAFEHYGEFGDRFTYLRVEDDVPPTFLNAEFEDWAAEAACHAASLARHERSFSRPYRGGEDGEGSDQESGVEWRQVLRSDVDWWVSIWLL